MGIAPVTTAQRAAGPAGGRALKQVSTVSLCLLAAAFSLPVPASPALAADKGCYNCHGNPPRKQAPTFAKLAEQYAPARDDPARLAQLADKLRDGPIFGHIDAHERLSPEVALQLVRWIAEGAQ